jgi:hypothetical protein
MKSREIKTSKQKSFGPSIAYRLAGLQELVAVVFYLR